MLYNNVVGSSVYVRWASHCYIFYVLSIEDTEIQDWKYFTTIRMWEGPAESYTGWTQCFGS